MDNNIEIVRTDYDIAKFKEKVKKIDLAIITAKGGDYTKYTYDELAMISYKLEKTTKENAPMLFQGYKRIFTHDIPLKLLDFFNVEINKLPNEYGFVEKRDIPLFSKFWADNGITKSLWNKWLDRYTGRVDGEMLIRAIEIAQQFQENIIINGTAQNVFTTAYGTFLSKNLLGMTDNIVISQKLELGIEKFNDLTKLTDDELNKYLSDPKSFMKMINEVNSGKIDDGVISLPIVEESSI